MERKSCPAALFPAWPAGWQVLAVASEGLLLDQSNIGQVGGEGRARAAPARAVPSAIEGRWESAGQGWSDSSVARLPIQCRRWPYPVLKTRYATPIPGP